MFKLSVQKQEDGRMLWTEIIEVGDKDLEDKFENDISILIPPKETRTIIVFIKTKLSLDIFLHGLNFGLNVCDPVSFDKYVDKYWGEMSTDGEPNIKLDIL